MGMYMLVRCSKEDGIMYCHNGVMHVRWVWVLGFVLCDA
jgi:hypothetical protein